MIINNFIKDFQIKRRNRNQILSNRELAKKFGSRPLLKAEKNAVRETWKGLDIIFDLNFYTIVKNFLQKDFDPKYVSQDLFYPYILSALNPPKFRGALDYKGLYHRLYPEFKQPICYVNSVGGIMCDGQNQRIKDIKSIIRILDGKDFLIKPTTDTLCGKNVQVIHSATKEQIKDIIEQYKHDFIIQEICKQSEKTKVFNPTSLNTFRITTLYLNDHFSVLNILFRCGRGNVVVDNGGAGGLMCGCSSEGQLMPYALDNDLNKYTESSTGQQFGIVIPEVKNIIDNIEKNIATALPLCAFAGWDFALNENNEPVMIEVNLGGSLGLYPGIFTEQLCNETPLFGDRTNEVINWVKNHRPHLRDMFM